MKTAARSSILVSLDSSMRRVKAAIRRQSIRALHLHLQTCAEMAEAYRRK
jgi:hypothetical protein